MINRIRDVRRGRRLTLKDVADRCDPPTTAQTIGRLETGTRTLSLEWLNRIAAALDVDSSELVQTGADAVIPICAEVTAGGTHALSRDDSMVMPKPGEGMLALRISDTQGEYRAHDMIWVKKLEPEDYPQALNRDVLVPRPAGRFLFGRLIAHEQGRMQIIPLETGARQQIVNDPAWLGVADRLIRKL